MKLFSRKKEPSDPAIIINNCLKSTLNRISDSFEEDGYHWTKPWGVKRFESIILAKFLMDLAFTRLAEDKLNDDEKIGYTSLSKTSFSNLFNDEFSGILDYEDVQEEIDKKVESYFEVRRGSKPPLCWHSIYQLITRSKTKEKIQEDIQNKSEGLELIRGNENFAAMVPQYESQIKILKDKSNAFESAEMMIPHMFRFVKDKLRTIKLKKIKALSKKLAKTTKGKK